MKIHLGAWKRKIPGFINVDLCDFEHIHYKNRIDKLPFFNNNVADLIYCSHSLEYFDYEEAKAALIEWKRVLKKGGILRIAVPDFEKLIEIYKITGDLNKIIGPLYGKMKINTSGKDKLNILYHKMVYDQKLITELLNLCGYSNIKKYDWKKTIHKDYDDHSQAYFPHLDKKNGILISLNLEAQK